VKNFFFASPFFLNAIGIAIKDFEDGQRLQGFRSSRAMCRAGDSAIIV